MKRAPQPLLLLALLSAASCQPRMPNPNDRTREVPAGDTVSHRPPIKDVLERQTPSLMAIQGVTGTGEGRKDGEPVIVVYTSHITREDRIAIPGEVEGYEVEIREVGDVTAPPR